MKILFDYKIFYQQKVGGISNYFYHLGKELIKLNQDILYSIPLHKNEYLKKIEKNYKKGIYLAKFPSRINMIVENINHLLTKKTINSYKPNIIHETYYSEKIYDNKKLVCTVYDMINEKFSNFFPNSEEITKIKKSTVMRADHIICISERTKEDLINFFNVDENKITVTLLASSVREAKSKSLKKKFNNCLLFVGSRYGYKNFKNFIKAYSSSIFLKKNFKIIAYGGEKFSKIDRKILQDYKIEKNKVMFLQNNIYELSYLYSNVAALIYPSFYEGFGLPILEAMKCGCPVISSNGGSLMEVGGNGIEYFDPRNFESIKDHIERIVKSEELQKKSIEYGYLRSSQFSWSKCAEETQAIYNKIV